MIGEGDAVPHFDVLTVSGERFGYSTVWQRRILVLVTLPQSASGERYASELAARLPEFHRHEAACVATGDRLPWVPAPGALVADRWGETVFAVAAADVESLPSVRELLEWVEHVEARCPECEGEAK